MAPDRKCRVAPIALRALDGQADHRLDAFVALIEIEGDDFGIAVDAERELGEIVGADGEIRRNVSRTRRSECTLFGISHMT